MTEPRVLVLVEGRSDAAVVVVLAERAGLPAAGWRLLPMGGATNASGVLRHLAVRPPVVLGLCDEHEAPHLHRALTGPDDAVLVCEADLEDELLRALGDDAVLEVLAATGDLRSFRTLQGQPQHRGRPVDRQVHRFIAAGAGRKERIDAALAARLPPGAEPPPLRALLARIRLECGHAGPARPADGVSPDPA